jgi:hypothetical protein
MCCGLECDSDSRCRSDSQLAGVGGQSPPETSRALAATAVRLSTPSFWKICSKCFLTPETLGITSPDRSSPQSCRISSAPAPTKLFELHFKLSDEAASAAVRFNLPVQFAADIDSDKRHRLHSLHRISTMLALVASQTAALRYSHGRAATRWSTRTESKHC